MFSVTYVFNYIIFVGITEYENCKETGNHIKNTFEDVFKGVCVLGFGIWSAAGEIIAGSLSVSIAERFDL